MHKKVSFSTLYLILAFLLTTPIFLSFTSNSSISFAALGGVNQNELITIPLGLLVITLIIIFSSNDIILNRNIIAIISFWIALNFVFYITHQTILLKENKTFFAMCLFYVAVEFFWRLNRFYSKIDGQISPRKILIYLFFGYSLIIIISTEKSFLLDELKIYNFEQYFPFFLLYLMALTINNRVIFFLASIFCFFIAKLAVNTTVMLIILPILFVNLFPLNILKKIRTILLITIFSFPFWSLLLFPIIFETLNVAPPPSLEYRFQMWNTYISDLYRENLAVPMLGSLRSYQFDAHNQLIEIYRATTLVGVVVFFNYLWRIISAIAIRDLRAAITIAIISLIGGYTGAPLLHPHTAIGLAATIAAICWKNTPNPTSSLAPSITQSLLISWKTIRPRRFNEFSK